MHGTGFTTGVKTGFESYDQPVTNMANTAFEGRNDCARNPIICQEVSCRDDITTGGLRPYAKGISPGMNCCAAIFVDGQNLTVFDEGPLITHIGYCLGCGHTALHQIQREWTEPGICDVLAGHSTDARTCVGAARRNGGRG